MNNQEQITKLKKLGLIDEETFCKSKELINKIPEMEKEAQDGYSSIKELVFQIRLKLT